MEFSLKAKLHFKFKAHNTFLIKGIVLDRV